MQTENETAKTDVGDKDDLLSRQIYIDGRTRPLAEALELMTDDFIDHGNMCDQTAIDIREALKAAISIIQQNAEAEGRPAKTPPL